ncbi:hypothetical protein [Streptomyces sp. NBC_01506]|uniref:hypothetical protein n=1 Tax=Streptomyces sp. NBC_01506 TaxID=2903887 RepID=UPI00386B7B61
METTVTIKYGKSYDDTWAVFKGTSAEIRANILEFFGMDPTTQQGLSLSGVVINATNIAHGKGLIATALGATVVEETAPNTEPTKPTGDPWAAASASSGSASVTTSKQADPNAYILGEIAKKATVKELKELWAANQTFFSDPAVMAAWKAKGKALQGA